MRKRMYLVIRGLILLFFINSCSNDEAFYNTIESFKDNRILYDTVVSCVNQNVLTIKSHLFKEKKKYHSDFTVYKDDVDDYPISNNHKRKIFNFFEQTGLKRFRVHGDLCLAFNTSTSHSLMNFSQTYILYSENLSCNKCLLDLWGDEVVKLHQDESWLVVLREATE